MYILYKFFINKMIKKISKVFNTNNLEDKSIKEWTLYHEVHKTNKNLDTKIKFNLLK